MMPRRVFESVVDILSETWHLTPIIVFCWALALLCAQQQTNLTFTQVVMRTAIPLSFQWFLNFYRKNKQRTISQKSISSMKEIIYIYFLKTNWDICSLASALENCANLTWFSSLVHVMCVCVCVSWQFHHRIGWRQEQRVSKDNICGDIHV